MRHLGYLAMLSFCLLGTLPLELVLRVGVYRQLRRLALTALPVIPIYLVWDAYAISRGHWTFDRAQVLPLATVAGLPLEEVSFFLVIPLTAVLTLEAVRTVRGWPIGDDS